MKRTKRNVDEAHITHCATILDFTDDVAEARAAARSELDAYSSELALVAGAILSSFRCAQDATTVHPLVNKIQTERVIRFSTVRDWLDERFASDPASRKLSALDLAKMIVEDTK
jgi:hypothetical protein